LPCRRPSHRHQVKKAVISTVHPTTQNHEKGSKIGEVTAPTTTAAAKLTTPANRMYCISVSRCTQRRYLATVKLWYLAELSDMPVSMAQSSSQVPGFRGAGTLDDWRLRRARQRQTLAARNTRLPGVWLPRAGRKVTATSGTPVCKTCAPRPAIESERITPGWCGLGPQALISATSTGLRRGVDAAFPEIGEMARGGHEVAVVVEDDKIVVRRYGTDQQVHGRQRAMRAVA
jgi:hypothetical protein